MAYTAEIRAPNQHPRCEIEGALLIAHEECRVCDILVGPLHIETALDQYGRCSNCALPRHSRFYKGRVRPAPPVEYTYGVASA